MLSLSSGNNAYPEWLDFEYLRQQGLLHIGRLSGNIWTDHNTHDPGITILEVLCYALLDLGYRNQFDTASLFARNPADAGKTDDVFFAPAEILSVNPVTPADFKRLLLDIPGVRNAWLQKADKQETAIYADKTFKKLTLTSNADTKEVKIQGLYDVYIDLEAFTPVYGSAGKVETEEQVVTAVWKQLQAHRPLCEDFKSVQVIKTEEVRFCMDIDLTPNAVPEDVFVEIFEAIQQFLTPVAKFYTLQEMLEKGRSIDQVFEGRPLLTDERGQPVSHGFTDTEELVALDPKSELHLSDIYNLILNQLPGGGVRAIRSLKFFTEGTPLGDAWKVALNPLKSPRLNAIKCEILYSKGQLPIEFDVASVQRKLNQRLANYYKIRRKPYELGFDIPQGKYYNLADYTSIQREFPAVYGAGEGQLAEIDPRMDEKERQFRESRLRQALQLKGYLAFFDQMLANYLAQLANVRTLFALRPAVPSNSSYFNASVTSMPDASRILRQMEAIGGVPEESYTLFRRRPIATMMPVPAIESPKFSDYDGVFATRALRDSMAYFFQNAFSDGSISAEIIDRWEMEDPNISPCDRFYYLFKLSGGGTVLRSNEFYETKTAVEEAVELARYLGFLSRCYANQDTEAGYGTALVYDPLAYADFLQHITESETDFLSRREQFLDHLLARFAEQFTEYALLAYAMEGKAKAQPEVVADKARFLANYPLVSRNRGKGFDYTKLPVWDTDNVSGFEQRVAGFMGLDDWKRRTLNHIKLNSDVLTNQTEWKWGDTVLFQTMACTSSDTLAQLFANGDLLTIDCQDEGIFGFKLRDPKTGCETRYLPCFSSAESRDVAIGFWKNWAAGKKVEAWERKDRFRFVLRDTTGIAVLRSTDFFDDETSAAKAFYLAVQLTFDINNYRDETRPADATNTKGFGFSLLDAAKKVVAAPIFWYDTPEKRDTAKADFIAVMRQCYLAFSVEKTEEALEWRILSAQGHALLIGTQQRRAGDQTGAFETIWQAIQHARQNNSWELTLSENGLYYWSLAKIDAQTRLFSPPETPQNRIEIARSAKRYSTEAEALADFNLLREQLLAPVSLENALIPEGNTAWRFQLLNPDDGSALLRSKNVYASLAEAAIAYEALIEAAGKVDHYTQLPNGRLEARFQYEKPTGYNDKTDTPVFTVVEDSALSAYPLPNGAAVQMAATIDKNATRLKTLSTPKTTFFHRFRVPGAGENEGNIYDLFGTTQYESEDAAWAAIPGLLTLFKNQGVSVEKSPDSDYYRLVLRKGGKETAVSVEEYPKAPILRTFSDLKPNPDLTGDTFGYRIGFLDCACELQYFYSTDGVVFNTAGEAEAAGLAIFNHIKEACPEPAIADTFTIVVKDDVLQIVHCVDKKIQAVTKPAYKNGEKARMAAFSFWKANFNISTSETVAVPFTIDYQPAESFRQLPSFNPTNPADPGLSRFRLRDDAYAIACYYQTFSQPEQRGEAMFAFRQYWQKANRQFPLATRAMTFQAKEQVLITSGSGDKCAPPRRIQPWCYRFSLICDDKTYTFDSVAPYDSEEAAKDQIADLTLMAQINLLADPAAYLIVDVDGTCKTFCLQVFDYTCDALKPKLILSGTFSTEKEARMAQKALLKCASAYPLYLDKDGNIRFRLIQWQEPDPNSDALKYFYPWQSIHTYPTLQEANCAFQEFLRLLEYPANIRYTEKPWSLDVGEIMLESVEYPLPPASEYPNCAPRFRRELNIWEKGVEGQLMSRVFRPDGVVIVPDADSCQYYYQVVNDGYCLATHPHWYRDASERTRQKKAIQRTYLCGEAPLSGLIFVKKEEDKTKTKECNGQTIEVLIEGYYYFELKAHDAQETDVVWRMPLPPSHKEITDAMAWYLLTPWAEYPDFYQQTLLPDGKVSLSMCDEDGKIIATAWIGGSSMFSKEMADKAMLTTVLQAREHPIKRKKTTRKGGSDEYLIQIYSRYWSSKVNKDKIPGAYLWTGKYRFETAEEAATFFDQCFQPEANHWIGGKNGGCLDTQQPDCGDFGFDLVNPDRIVAYYPARFDTRHEAEKSVEKMRELLNTEGFHLLENILLRPIFKPESDDALLSLPKELTKLWDTYLNAKKGTVDYDFQSCFNIHLPGSDPYSAYVTVILPFWVPRFQNARFREFFENTLRRELPAHCRMRVVWATPRDMFEFEIKYRHWLTALAAGEPDDGKAEMTQVVSNINSYYRLILDDPKSFLDEVTLS